MTFGKRTAIAMPSEIPKAGAGQPCLVIIAGPELGRQIDLSKEIDVGREAPCALIIESDLVSRRHATVQRFSGAYILADLGSTNGTYVNEEKVTTKQLADGDLIRIGKTVLKFMASGNVEAAYHQQIFNMVSVDALTGAYNKRYFDDNFKKEMVRAASTRTPLSLVLFDIDHFKRINDTYGHPAGDAVLKTLAMNVKDLVRDKDIFARVGGEEFALILTGMDKVTAAGAAEIVRGTIEMTEFSFDGRIIPVTLSLGVAELVVGDEPETLYKRADEALYRAKRSGRNQVA